MLKEFNPDLKSLSCGFESLADGLFFFLMSLWLVFVFSCLLHLGPLRLSQEEPAGGPSGGERRRV